MHLFISDNKLEQMWVRIRDNMIWENRTVKLLGIKIDNELKFDEYLTNICIIENRKLSFDKNEKIFGFHNKVRLLLISFFESQFKYCPLMWMF